MREATLADSNVKGFANCPYPDYVLEVGGQRVTMATAGLDATLAFIMTYIQTGDGFESKGYATQMVEEFEKIAMASNAPNICAKYVQSPKMERILAKKGYVKMNDVDDHWCKKLFAG